MSSNQHTARLPYHKLSSKAFMGLVGVSETIKKGPLGTRLAEETTVKPKPMVEIGGKPVLWHLLKSYSHHGINDFVICCGYKQYIIKEYFANYFRHNSDMTVDLSNNTTTILDNHSENWKVTMVDTGEQAEYRLTHMNDDPEAH